MPDVIRLDDRRPSSSTDEAVCTCGSRWFRLTGPDGGAPPVTMNLEGSITGYAGVTECMECGRTSQ